MEYVLILEVFKEYVVVYSCIKCRKKEGGHIRITSRYSIRIVIHLAANVHNLKGSRTLSQLYEVDLAYQELIKWFQLPRKVSQMYPEI
jgi:hypothetical protein